MVKRLLVASTTIVCLAVLTNSLGIAKTDKIKADAKHGVNQPNGSKDHHDQTIEIPAGQPIPLVNLIVHKDPMKGYNLETQVTNFRFAPENASKAAKPGEGHAHIYVNGKKINRLYGSWYYLENLQPGKNEITVSLNANSHQALVHNGERIKDTKVIQVPN